ncbi:MAG: branched-chain amino acid ABC transporter permease [Acidimicrobiales bacterium]
MNWPLIISNTLFTAVSIQAIAFILAAIGVNLHFGYTGLLNFGQAAFAAVGAYTFAVLAGQGIPWPFGSTPPGGFESPWPWWAAAVAVLPMASVLALLLGIPTLRLRADYLAIVTIAAAEILRQALIAPKLDDTWGTGGSDGLQGFTGGIERINPWDGKRFSLWEQPFSGHVAFIMVVGWVLIVLSSLVIWALMRSPWGRVLRSIREDEDAARSLGKNVFAYKMQSLILGGIVGALGGLIFAVGGRAAAPNDYSTAFTFFAWTMLILGGSGRVKGPIIGGVIFWLIIGFTEVVLSQATRNNLLPDWLVNENNFGLLRFMFVGLGLTMLVVFRPQGIFGDRREQAFDVR